MSKFNKLYDAISQGKTILGVGPMSLNCIDAVIDVANEYKIPMQLIASRRQVECKELGGGYVSTTEEFSSYVKCRDVGGYIYLARDHGGPWQGTNEQNLTHNEAMLRAKISYQQDIKSGFDIIHLDPSLGSRQLEFIIADVKELYHFCNTASCVYNNDVLFEAGTEEHSGQIGDLHNFEYFIHQIGTCSKIKFVVGNMGLHVKELQNIGNFDSVQAKNLVDICNKNSLYLKGHNVDYVSCDVLNQKNKIGVHSINIAPELGTLETSIILNQLNESHKNKFIDLCIQSKKWEKWMINKDRQNEVSKSYIATVCGHYLFNSPEVKEMTKDIDNSNIQSILKERIKFYLYELGWEEVDD